MKIGTDVNDICENIKQTGTSNALSYMPEIEFVLPFCVHSSMFNDLSIIYNLY